MILIPNVRSFFALSVECKLMVLVSYSCSEAMTKVSLQSISGAHVELSVHKLEASLYEKMQDICSSFNKPYPPNWAVLTSKKTIFEQPDSQAAKRQRMVIGTAAMPTTRCTTICSKATISLALGNSWKKVCAPFLLR